jgi:two-component system cell cycle response regulator
LSASDDISLVPLGGLSIEAGADTGLVVAVGDRPVTVGRETGCEVRLTDTSCSRRHIRVLPGPAGGVVLEDLGSANGTFVNGAKVSNVTLTPGDLIVIGETTIRFLSEGELLAALRERTTRVTERDPLTQTCTRRMFDMRLRTEVTLAARSGGTVSLALIAIDALDAVREKRGELGEERVLKAAGLALGGYLRENDLLARFDATSFATLIIEPSPNTAYLVAERMCAGIEGLAVDVGGQSIPVTASIGLASEKGRRDLTPDGLVDRARGQLESAREAGGNCVSRWVHPAVREPVPAVSGDLRGTMVGSQRKS